MRKTTVLGVALGIVSAGLVTTPVLAGSASADEAHRAVNRFEVTAKVSETEPLKNDKIKIRGEVKPARPGQEVKLQLRYGKSGKWKTSDTDTLNAKGKFTFVDEVSSVRFRQYRVVKPASGTNKTGMSSKLGVTVYGWRTLTSLQPATTHAMYEESEVTINAHEYPSSLLADAPADEGSIDYNLNRGCKTLEARYGLDDSSETTATGTVELESDGVSKYDDSFALTESQFNRQNVTGVFRITFRWTSANTEGTVEDQSGAYVAVASPRVLCNF